MKIDRRSLVAGLIKLILFVSFYAAGYFTNAQLSQYTIVSQKERIDTLEQETALQRLQINELNRRSAINAESIQTLKTIQNDIDRIKAELNNLREFHNK